MLCPKCGKETRDGAKFCASCGASIESVAANCDSPVQVLHEAKQPKKSKGLSDKTQKIILISIIGALVIALAIVLIIFLSPDKTDDGEPVDNDKSTTQKTELKNDVVIPGIPDEDCHNSEEESLQCQQATALLSLFHLVNYSLSDEPQLCIELDKKSNEQAYENIMKEYESLSAKYNDEDSENLQSFYYYILDLAGEIPDDICPSYGKVYIEFSKERLNKPLIDILPDEYKELDKEFFSDILYTYPNEIYMNLPKEFTVYCTNGYTRKIDTKELVVNLIDTITSAFEKNARAKTCMANQREILGQLNNYSVSTGKALSGTIYITTNDDATSATVTSENLKGITVEEFKNLFMYLPYCPEPNAVVEITITESADGSCVNVSTYCHSNSNHDIP